MRHQEIPPVTAFDLWKITRKHCECFPNSFFSVDHSYIVLFEQKLLEIAV